MSKVTMTVVEHRDPEEHEQAFKDALIANRLARVLMKLGTELQKEQP